MVMSSYETPNFCRCGAATEEDWEYCSIQCGRAAAFEKLTAKREVKEDDEEGAEEEEEETPTLTPPTFEEELDVDFEGRTISSFFEMLQGIETPTSHAAWDRRSHKPDPADDTYSASGTFGVGEWNIGRDRQADFGGSRPIPPVTHGRNPSRDTTESSKSSGRSSSRSSGDCSSPTTSISSVELHAPLLKNSQLPRPTAPLSIGKKLRQLRRRGRTMPHLKADIHEDYHWLTPEVTASTSAPRTLLDSSNATIGGSEPSKEVGLDRNTVVGPEEWDGIISTHGPGFEVTGEYNPAQGHSGRGSNNTRLNSFKARARRKPENIRSRSALLHEPTAPSTRRKVPSDTLTHGQTPVDSSNTSDTHTDISSRIRKISGRVFSKGKRQSPRPPPIVLDISSKCVGIPFYVPESSSHSPTQPIIRPVTPSLSGSLSATSHWGNGSLRPTSPDVPTSPTATVSSVATSSSYPLAPNTALRAKFMFTRQREPRGVSSQLDHGNAINPDMRATASLPFTPDYIREDDVESIPVLGPGQPMYIRVDIRENSVRTVHEDNEDDVWRDFVAIERTRESSTLSQSISWT